MIMSIGLSTVTYRNIDHLAHTRPNAEWRWCKSMRHAGPGCLTFSTSTTHSFTGGFWGGDGCGIYFLSENDLL